MAIGPERRAELLTLPAHEREEAEIADGRVALIDADEVHDELRAEVHDATS